MDISVASPLHRARPVGKPPLTASYHGRIRDCQGVNWPAPLAQQLSGATSTAGVFEPAGDLPQKPGGVSLCSLALTAAAGLDPTSVSKTTTSGVLSKPLEHFAKLNQAKNDAGFFTPDCVPNEK